MDDFRTRLYRKYNSTFKQVISSFDDKIIKKEWDYYNFKYWPHFKKYPIHSKILELGCGRGIMLKFLLKKGFKNIKGIDVSEEQIEIAKRNNLDVQAMDVFRYLDTNNDKFDIIIAIDFIEHFDKQELLILFDGIFDCLNTGGILVVHTPNGQAILSGKMIYGDFTHLTIFTPNSIKQLLELIGFGKIVVYEKGPVPKNLKGAIRSLLWILTKLFYNGILLIESGKTEKILTQNFICVAKKKE